jgi:hypothetical protein
VLVEVLVNVTTAISWPRLAPPFVTLMESWLAVHEATPGPAALREGEGVGVGEAVVGVGALGVGVGA